MMERRPHFERLRDQVAIVGCSSAGIGPRIASALAREGAAVMAHYQRDATAAASVVKAIEAAGGRAQTVQGDLSQPAEAAAVIAAAPAAFGRLDILVTIAEAAPGSSVLGMRDEGWTAAVSGNLNGAFYSMRAALREFVRQRHGRIIAVTAPGFDAGAAYITGRAGLVGLARAVAREVGSRGITVNAVAPGAVNDSGSHSRSMERALEPIPLARPGTADEIAAAVVFLASEEAGYVTGQVLHVDGGMIMD